MHKIDEMTDLIWRAGRWSDVGRAAAAVRHTVFIAGMGVAPALDFDGTDDDAHHLVVYSVDRPIATGRLYLPEAQIGRLAVLPEYRGRGIGAELLRRLLDEAVRRGFRTVKLHAQEQAIPFYLRFGFREEGALFDEAGIPHRLMRCSLQWTDAVAAVIVRDGRLLLGLRAPETILGDHWDLFGGRIEAGEDAEEALRRELREELGIEAAIGPQLAVCLYRDPAGGTLFRAPVFQVTTWSGALELNAEHSDCAWFAPEELERLELAHPAIPGLLAQALEGLSRAR
ncbi:MAG: GNAT family N-acetyltransferase [Candidatus Eisenbacteria bacterium]|nr:GNAT family N-acetyltransferase [Candidatus Eisenbacteria bacterium]